MSTVEKLDRLIADQLQAALPSAVIGRQVVVLEQTASTNDAILQVASPQGAAVSSLPAVASAKEASAVPRRRGSGSFRRASNRRARSAREPLGINRGKRSLVFNPVTTRDPAQRLGMAHDLGDRNHLGRNSHRVRPPARDQVA